MNRQLLLVSISLLLSFTGHSAQPSALQAIHVATDAAGDNQTPDALSVMLGKQNEAEFRAAMDGSWTQTEASVYSTRLANGETIEMAFGPQALRRELSRLETIRSRLQHQLENSTVKQRAERAASGLEQVNASIAALSANTNASKAGGSITYNYADTVCLNKTVYSTTVLDASISSGGANGSASVNVSAAGSGLIGSVSLSATAWNYIDTDFNSVPLFALYPSGSASTSSSVYGDWDCELATSMYIRPGIYASPCSSDRTINRYGVCSVVATTP